MTFAAALLPVILRLVAPSFGGDLPVAAVAQTPPPPPTPCEQAHNDLSFYDGYGRQLCKYNDRARLVPGPAFEQCLATLRAADLMPSYGPFCFYYRASAFTPAVIARMKSTLRSLSPWFWHYEEMRQLSLPKNSTVKILPPLFIQRFMKEAKAPAQPSKKLAANKAPSARVINEWLLHSSTLVKGSTLPLGGLSGLTVRGEHLYAITDDKVNPLILRWKMTVRNDRVRFTEEESRPLPAEATSGNDFEDLTFTRDGRLLVSSEPSFTIADDPFFIYELSDDWQSATGVRIAPELLPGSIVKPAPCPKGKKPVKLPSGKIQQCTVSLPTGMRFNRGLEAMAADPNTDRLYYASEFGLAQSKRASTKIYQVNLNSPNPEIPEATFEYPLPTTNDTGVVALTVVNSNTLLVLERGFDAKKEEAKVKLYRVILPANGQTPLRKDLVLDFESLRPQLSAGFQTIENFEGIAIGPDLTTGEATLIFVSDNNFNLRQKTEFLTIALPKASLTEVEVQP